MPDTVLLQGWDKTYCLQFVQDDFDDIHFFGDKTFQVLVLPKMVVHWAAAHGSCMCRVATIMKSSSRSAPSATQSSARWTQSSSASSCSWNLLLIWRPWAAMGTHDCSRVMHRCAP